MVIKKRRFHHLYFQNYIVKNFICGITRHVRLGIVLLLISRNSSKQARVYHRAAGVYGEKLLSNWQRYQSAVWFLVNFDAETLQAHLQQTGR